MGAGIFREQRVFAARADELYDNRTQPQQHALMGGKRLSLTPTHMPTCTVTTTLTLRRSPTEECVTPTDRVCDGGFSIGRACCE